MAGIDLKKLQTTLARIEEERDRLAKEAANFRGVLEYYAAHPEELDAVATPSSKQLHEGIVAILREAGSPLHVNEIYHRLVQRGIRIAGETPARNVGGHLSLLKGEGITKDSGQRDGKWRLAEWDKNAHEVDFERHIDEAQNIIRGH